MPHCLGAVGTGALAMHGLTAWRQWAVELLKYSASLPGGSGQWKSCNAPPHGMGAVGCATPAMHYCPQAMRQCIAEVPVPTAPRQWGNALHELHYPLPPGSEALCCKSSTADCPPAVRQCIAGVPLPTALRNRGWALQEFHCPLPQVVRHYIVGVALPAAPWQ